MQNLLPPVSFPADKNVALTSCLQGILPYQDKKILEKPHYNYRLHQYI